MDNPGPFQFTYDGGGLFPLSAPGTYAGDWQLNLEGIVALSVQAQFIFGSGGTTATLFIQTSLDQGNTAIDIAAIQFGVANATEAANLSGLTPRTTPVVPQQQGLTPGTCQDGLLGDRFRAVLVIAGAGYGSNSALNAVANAR